MLDIWLSAFDVPLLVVETVLLVLDIFCLTGVSAPTAAAIMTEAAEAKGETAFAVG